VHAYDDTRKRFAGIWANNVRRIRVSDVSIRDHRDLADGMDRGRRQDIPEGIFCDPDMTNGLLHIQATIDGQPTMSRSRRRHWPTARKWPRPLSRWTAISAYLTLPSARQAFVGAGNSFLYDLTLSLVNGGEIVDVVQSYFGLRQDATKARRYCQWQRGIPASGTGSGILPGRYLEPLQAMTRCGTTSNSPRRRVSTAHGCIRKYSSRVCWYWADKLGYMVCLYKFRGPRFGALWDQIPPQKKKRGLGSKAPFWPF